MIQRIQTIYLFLAALCFGSLFTLPFATSSEPVPHLMSDLVYDITDHPVLLGITILGILLAVISILMFKNRGTQQRLVQALMIMCMFLPLVAILLIYNEATAAPASAMISDKFGVFMPLIALVLSILAWRGIRKDDGIVKSMDRLR
jgi:hypothetical membrane protein